VYFLSVSYIRKVRDSDFSVGMGTKEDESSTGWIWAAGFHHVMAQSCLALILKRMNCLFLTFSKFVGEVRQTMDN
jgi:hypothetical protein